MAAVPDDAGTGAPVEVYRATRYAAGARVVAVLVLAYFVGFAALSSADRMSGGQRALAVALGVVLAAAIWRLGRRRLEVGPDGVTAHNYLTTHRLRWEEIAEVRAIPAGLEVRAGDGRRVLISALARWNWRPYLGGEPPVEDIAARIAARVGAAGRPSPG